MAENKTNANGTTKEIIFIVDKSGSMGGLETDTIGGFNAMLREQQAQTGSAVSTAFRKR